MFPEFMMLGHYSFIVALGIPLTITLLGAILGWNFSDNIAILFLFMIFLSFFGFSWQRQYVNQFEKCEEKQTTFLDVNGVGKFCQTRNSTNKEFSEPKLILFESDSMIINFLEH